jgi:hypothetical protein
MTAKLLLALLVVGACIGDGGQGATEQEPAAAPAEAVSFEVVVDEATCGLSEPVRQVVQDQEAWARLWERLHRPVEPAPELPEVDFSREMLIAVATGNRRSSGFDISVHGITVQQDAVEVTVHETCPARGAMVGMVLTQPVQVVRLPTLRQKPSFRETKAPSCN